MPEIFVSYSSVDGSELAAILSRRLVGCGYAVHSNLFMPYDLCLLVVTPDALQSARCQQEWSALTKPAIVLTSGPMIIPQTLVIYPHVYFASDFEAAFSELIEQVEWLYDPALRRLQSAIHAKIYAVSTRQRRINGSPFLQGGLISLAAAVTLIFFAFLLSFINDRKPVAGPAMATNVKTLMVVSATKLPASPVSSPGPARLTPTLLPFSTLTPSQSVQQPSWTPLPIPTMTQIVRTPTLTWTPIPVIVTTVAPSLTPLPQVNVTQLDIYPQTNTLQLGDTIGENVAYTANSSTRVIIDGGLIYPSDLASTGMCAESLTTFAPGPALPYINTTYQTSSVSFNWGPLAFGSSTDTLDANADRYVLQTRIFALSGELLSCYQQVWTIVRFSQPQVNVSSINIYPQDDTLRPGDSLSHTMIYMASVPTNASIYGGWVYGGTPASTGSCLDQEAPPAPGTDFPFLMSETSFAAGNTSFDWGPAVFSEDAGRAYDQTDRYVYRVRIYDATTNMMLYCYQQVWTIDRASP